MYKFCICNKINLEEGGIFEEFICINVKEYVELCGRENEFSLVKKGLCVERYNRKKWFIKYFIIYFFDNFVIMNIVERIKVI